MGWGAELINRALSDGNLLLCGGAGEPLVAPFLSSLWLPGSCLLLERDVEGCSQAPSLHNVNMGQPRIIRARPPPRAEFLCHFVQIIILEEDADNLLCQSTQMPVSTRPLRAPGPTPRWPLIMSLGILMLPSAANSGCKFKPQVPWNLRKGSFHQGEGRSLLGMPGDYINNQVKLQLPHQPPGALCPARPCPGSSLPGVLQASGSHLPVSPRTLSPWRHPEGRRAVGSRLITREGPQILPDRWSPWSPWGRWAPGISATEAAEKFRDRTALSACGENPVASSGRCGPGGGPWQGPGPSP